MVFFACSRKNAAVELDESSEVKAMEEKKEFQISGVETMMQMPDCLTEYKDLDRINPMHGELVTVMDKLMIKHGTSGRYDPCNLPEGYRDGDHIMFGGFVKESPPNVRLAGTPFRLTFIKKK